jgi:CARDB
MRRMVAVTAGLATLLGGTVATRAAGAPTAGGPGTVAKVVSCDVTVTTSRSAAFYGRMDTIPGASKLALRFVLLERLGRDDTWNKVDLAALRQWHTSQAGVTRYGWKQTVDNLHVGGAYKARIQYRWLSSTGDVLDSQVRDTTICKGPLPNIALGQLTSKPGPTADTRIYRVEVENTGKGDADEVDVSLSVDRAVLDTITLDQLAAGDVRTVSFNGPACHREVSVTADPANAIGERLEDDNSQVFSCP